MNHPWHEIPIGDYEAHMALPSVGQASLLASTLHRAVSQGRPRSLAVLGVAGGNGLDLVDPAIVHRVVALDFNREYLDLCVQRHARSFTQFEPILHDLSQGPPAMAPVDCIFAGLVLEYLPLDSFIHYLPSLLADDCIFATLLQLPSSELPEVSASPYPSLTRLQPSFSFVDPPLLHEALNECGFVRVEVAQYDLASRKSFHYAAYRLMRRPDA